MKIFTKISRFLKRCISRIVFFFIRNDFDEFVGNSATLQNIQNLQRMISEEVNADRFKINKFEKKIDTFVKNSNESAEFINFSAARFKMKNKIDNVPEIDYVKFENKYRGDEDLIRDRQSEFLPFFKMCTNVLDIGCGRGEFLELIGGMGIKATGIDINKGMIEVCKRKGLNVIEADLLEFIDNMKENEVDGIFCSQVIEHFSFKEIKWILHTLSKKLKKDAVVLFETINPRCLPALRYFYLDATHVQPVDYETLAFFIESYGFRVNAGVLSSPVDSNSDKTTHDLSLIDQYRDYALIINKI